MHRRIATVIALLGAAMVACYALWYTSSGRFPVFPPIQNDYVDLGESFRRGQLSLLEQPDPRLAGLDDPYEYAQRKDIPYHWDASFYKEKYYLYWGPVPGIVSAIIQGLRGSPPSASLLVVIPYIGLLAVFVALSFHLAESFGAAARLSVWLFTLIGFFNLPMLFTIGQPRHYQASIMFGQFFLLAGLLAFILYTRDRRPFWLPLSGLAWGLAFASRYNLAVSIAVYTVFSGIWLWRDRGPRLWTRLTLLVVPLAVCLLGLGIYNLARFGDPFETGLTYQLTIPEFRGISYSRAYVPSGLYAYLLYPLTGSGSFPFIQAAHFTPRLLPESLFVPPGREFDQIVFGLFPSVPAVWLFVVVIPFALSMILHRGDRAPSTGHGIAPAAVLLVLAIGAAGQFAFLLVFFYVAERYLVDFYLPVVLCLAMLVWWTHTAFQRTRLLQVALWALVAGVALWTVAIGYFACFGVPVLVSIYYDPQMLAKLAAFWNSGSTVLQFLVPGTH